MATEVIIENNAGLLVEFNRGDLNALKEIKESWKFKNFESALRFGLAVLKMSSPDNLYINKDFSIQIINPADSLLL